MAILLPRFPPRPPPPPPPPPRTPTADDIELQLRRQSRLKDISRVLRGLGLMRLEDTPDVGLTNFKTRMAEAPRDILGGLRRLGRTPDSESFIRSLKPDIDEDGLTAIFGAPPSLPPVTQPPVQPLPRAKPSLPAQPSPPVQPPPFPPPTPTPTPFPPPISPVPQPAPGTDVWGGLKVLGEGLATQLPAQVLSRLRMLTQGGSEGASVRNKDVNDAFIAEAQERAERFVEKITAQYGEKKFIPGIKITDVAQLPQNLAYSVVSGGIGVAVAAPFALIPVAGGWLFAGVTAGVSGKVAFDLTSYEIMQQYLEMKDAESIATRGNGITLAEENQLKADFQDEAFKYGLWEAVPEGVSNLIGARLILAPLTKMFGGALVKNFIPKLFGSFGGEFLTETITQKGQAGVEFRAGMRENIPDWFEAFKEIAPQTALLLATTAGAGATAVGSARAISALKNEIGEGHPQFTRISDAIKTGLAEEARRVPVELKRLVTEEAGGVRLPGKMPEGERELVIRRVGKSKEGAPWRIDDLGSGVLVEGGFASREEANKAVGRIRTEARRAGRQDWQLSQIEYVRLTYPRAEGKGAFPSLEDEHEALIREALSEGKPVPAEVLKDYPDLARQAKVTPAPRVGEKELWQMTKGEFHKEWAIHSPKDPSVSQRDYDKLVDTWRRSYVGRAIRDGKPVPAEVLKDYPDLAAQTKVTPVAPEVTKPELVETAFGIKKGDDIVSIPQGVSNLIVKGKVESVKLSRYTNGEPNPTFSEVVYRTLGGKQRTIDIAQIDYEASGLVKPQAIPRAEPSLPAPEVTTISAEIARVTAERRALLEDVRSALVETDVPGEAITILPDGVALTGREFKGVGAFQHLAEDLPPVKSWIDAGAIRIAWEEGGNLSIELSETITAKQFSRLSKEIATAKNIIIEVTDYKGDIIKSIEGTPNIVRSQLRTLIPKAEAVTPAPEVTREFVIDTHSPMGQPYKTIIQFRPSENAEANRIMEEIRVKFTQLNSEQQGLAKAVFTQIQGEKRPYMGFYEKSMAELNLINDYMDRISTGKFDVKQLLSDAEKIEKAAIPRAEPSLPEAALQPSMLPEAEVVAKPPIPEPVEPPSAPPVAPEVTPEFAVTVERQIIVGGRKIPEPVESVLSVRARTAQQARKAVIDSGERGRIVKVEKVKAKPATLKAEPVPAVLEPVARAEPAPEPEVRGVPQPKADRPGVAPGLPPIDKPPFPAKPVIKADGKLWLPEPPRSIKELTAAARKAVSSSYRGKKGFLAGVEDAHQLVLKARDMGSNVVPYVMGYIRQVGNVTEEFGVDAQGLATKVGNPENRSLAINDVLSNWTHYELTKKQIELAKRHGFVYEEALKLAKSYGVEISELGSPDEFWQYIARRVVSKLDPLTGRYVSPQTAIGAFRMGAEISAQKERVFDEMAQGVNLGFLYENPEQTLAHHILGIYRLIGNKQAEVLVKPFTRQITKEAPLAFGERAIAQPALRQRAAAVEIANAIDKIFTPEQEIRALRIATDVSGAMVGQVAALDVSAPFIQGLPLLGHDLKQNLKGKPSAIWAKSYGHMWKAVFNPETINNFRMKHQELYKRYIEAGGMTGESEFVVGVGTTQRALGKIPWVGKIVKEVYRQSWGRLGAAYSDFLEVAKVRYFEQMEPVWQRAGRNMLELGALTNRMMGATSAAARGVGANRRLIERILAFAPNYLRSSLLLMKDMASRGATAREVQLSIAAMLAIGIAFYWAEEKLRGREPKMKPWPKKFGGDGASAYTIEVDGVNIGLGSWLYGMIKLLAEIGALAVDDPMALVKWNEWHPVNKFLRSKRGPLLSLVSDLATGKNFFGRRFDDGSDYLLRIAEAVVPIAGQSLLEPSLGAKPKAILTIAEFLGLRAFPASSVDRIDKAMTILGLAGATKGNLKERQQLYDEYWDIPSNLDELRAAIDKGEVRLSRDDYREDNPDVDAKLFIGGQVSTVKTKEAYDLVLELVKQLKLKPEEINAVKSWLEDEARRQKLGLEDKTVTMTDSLIRELLGIPPGKKEGIPSDKILRKLYFDYYALPSTSYLNFTQEQVDAGELPEKYRKEWETYQKLTNERAKTAFKKARNKKGGVAYGGWRDEFRRENTNFDAWMIEHKGLKPLAALKGQARIVRANRRAQAARSLFGGFRPVSGRRRRLAVPKFPKPSFATGISVGAPRV